MLLLLSLSLYVSPHGGSSRPFRWPACNLMRTFLNFLFYWLAENDRGCRINLENVLCRINKCLSLLGQIYLFGRKIFVPLGYRLSFNEL